MGANVSDQHFLATALKCLLHERVGRAKHNTIGNPTIQYLAQLVVALRTADDGPVFGKASNLVPAPSLESRPAHPFEPGFSFDRIETHALEKWVRSWRSESDESYAVYVIDCTPQVGEDEDARARELRAEVHAEGGVSEPRHKGAQAVNNGECVYYVGHSDHVPERMRQHANGMTYGGAKFLSLFKPFEIVELTWQETKSQATKYEKRRADKLTKPGGPYAFSETSQ
ncbi:GIY-YIG nuclease family protein [Halostella pelagica]|uniref:GIY-YIG nuclease family protein n=1 Tax=Halostella pelagica TaxID=2583824 RepID=UPI0010804BC7